MKALVLKKDTVIKKDGTIKDVLTVRIGDSEEKLWSYDAGEFGTVEVNSIVEAYKNQRGYWQLDRKARSSNLFATMTLSSFVSLATKLSEDLGQKVPSHCLLEMSMVYGGYEEILSNLREMFSLYPPVLAVQHEVFKTLLKLHICDATQKNVSSQQSNTDFGFNPEENFPF